MELTNKDKTMYVRCLLYAKFNGAYGVNFRGSNAYEVLTKKVEDAFEEDKELRKNKQGIFNKWKSIMHGIIEGWSEMNTEFSAFLEPRDAQFPTEENVGKEEYDKFTKGYNEITEVMNMYIDVIHKREII